MFKQLMSIVCMAVLISPDALAAGQPANDATFGIHLLKQVAKARPDGNIVIAPRNVRTALAAVATGASGRTRDQITALTGDYAAIDNPPSALAKRALMVWVSEQGKLNPDFVAGLKRADVTSTPRSTAAMTINAYVSQKTDGMIDHVIGPTSIPQGPGIVLTTALYFGGKWQEPFEKRDTWDDKFHVSGKQVETVPFMHQHGSFTYATSDNGQFVQLPYQSDDGICLTVFLPKPGLSIDTWLAGMDSAKWTALLAKRGRHDGELALPKLKSGFSISLNPELKAMGMVQAFSDQADFSGILENVQLKIAEVFHVTQVDMDELGTKAAAATRVSMTATARAFKPPNLFKMDIDRPYFFTIGDGSNHRILFAGVVRKP